MASFLPHQNTPSEFEATPPAIYSGKQSREVFSGVAALRCHLPPPMDDNSLTDFVPRTLAGQLIECRQLNPSEHDGSPNSKTARLRSPGRWERMKCGGR